MLPDDTSADARRVQDEVLRGLSGPQRMRVVADLTSFVHSFAIAGLRDRMPQADEAEIEAAWFRLVLDEELAAAVLRHRREVRGTARHDHST